MLVRFFRTFLAFFPVFFVFFFAKTTFTFLYFWCKPNKTYLINKADLTTAGSYQNFVFFLAMFCHAFFDAAEEFEFGKDAERVMCNATICKRRYCAEISEPDSHEPPSCQQRRLIANRGAGYLEKPAGASAVDCCPSGSQGSFAFSSLTCKTSTTLIVTFHMNTREGHVNLRMIPTKWHSPSHCMSLHSAANA